MDIQKVLEIVALRKDLESQITEEREEFNALIASKVSLLKNLEEQEAEMRNELLAEMKEHNEELIESDGSKITRQIKRTPYIDDIISLKDHMMNNRETYEAFGVDTGDLIDRNFLLEVVIQNKKEVQDAINNYIKVEGKLPEGVKEKETEFLAITL